MMAGATDGRAVSHTGMEGRLLGSPGSLARRGFGEVVQTLDNHSLTVPSTTLRAGAARIRFWFEFRRQCYYRILA